MLYVSQATQSSDPNVLVQVVPKDSAILPGYILIGIHAHHMDMTKFATVDDAGFVAVCGELRRWVREITKVESCSTNSRAETGRQPRTWRASLQLPAVVDN